jgi:hypothetical protein
MSRRSVGLILLAVASVGLGILAGLRYFHLFEITVPPAVLTDFNKGTARWAFIVYGMVTAAAIFVWSLIVILIAPLFKSKPAAPKPPPAPENLPPASADQPRT